MKRKNEIMISLAVAKVIEVLAREVAPFVLSILVRSGIKSLIKKRKSGQKPETTEVE